MTSLISVNSTTVWRAHCRLQHYDQMEKYTGPAFLSGHSSQTQLTGMDVAQLCELVALLAVVGTIATHHLNSLNKILQITHFFAKKQIEITYFDNKLYVTLNKATISQSNLWTTKFNFAVSYLNMGSNSCNLDGQDQSPKWKWGVEWPDNSTRQKRQFFKLRILYNCTTC